MDIFLKIIFCHLVGDYVLQNDFIAKTKGKNWYHLFVHCALYCLPFYIMFGMDIKLIYIFFSHVVIDALKARYKKINYATDQISHYVAAFILYLI